MPEDPEATIHWLPAPLFTGNPYSFRESRRLIDEAHDLAVEHLDAETAAGEPTREAPALAAPLAATSATR